MGMQCQPGRSTHDFVPQFLLIYLLVELCVKHAIVLSLSGTCRLAPFQLESFL